LTPVFCVYLGPFEISREETGKFPDYPSDEEGGSAAVFHPELHADLEGSEAAKNSEEAPVRSDRG
jgi:hypothetical protein